LVSPAVAWLTLLVALALWLGALATFAVIKPLDGRLALSTAPSATLIARALLPQFGFSSSEFTCLDELYTRESGWDVHADNPTSDAYGIPQALPGSKMASAGSDWMNDAATQIRWGLEYIRGSYGTPELIGCEMRKSIIQRCRHIEVAIYYLRQGCHV